MSERVCLVHYHEIGLKGRNRSAFERRLQGNLDAALVGLPVGSVRRIPSRLVVSVHDRDQEAEVARRMAAVPGVAAVSIAQRVAADPEEMEIAALEAMEAASGFSTFKVQSQRSTTQYTESTMAMNQRIGAFLDARTSARVKLDDPDLTISVVITQDDAYVGATRVRGVGGLPVGTAGRVVSLLSSGIDSPVATWRLIRRGAVAIGVHFSGVPHTSDASERLVVEIGHQLERAGGLGRIYLVRFGGVQREISLTVPPDLRVIMYRRMMFVVAQRIARAEKAKALVTGESLGQVASQTLDNIAAIEQVATLPVLRPLIGTDKQEIIADARRIGTYEISISDHTDCCTLFMPRNPETHAKMHAVLDAWAMLDVDALMASALDGLAWHDFACESYRPLKRVPGQE